LESGAEYVKRGVTYLDWRKYSPEKMCKSFSDKFEGINIHQTNVDDINEKITTAMCLSLNELVPKRRANLLGKNPVISPEIRNLRNKKSRLMKKWKRTGELIDYQHLQSVSDQLNYEIKNERKKSLCKSLSGTSKDYWKVINSVIGKSVNEGFKIMDEGREIENDFDVANLFAEFFKGKVEKLENESLCEQYILPDINPQPGQSITYFNEKDVEASIDLLKSSKAMGFDEIPGNTLKHLKTFITKPLCWLFNVIMDNGIVPKAWKISKITPIHKKGDKSSVLNYRPVSNISSLSKIFERCIINKLRITNEDVLFGSHQHAFRKGASTVTAGLTMQDFISTEMDQGRTVLAYSADLTAAFDVLRPNLLVKELINLKVESSIVRVIYDFLQNRRAFVQVGDSNSYDWGMNKNVYRGACWDPSCLIST